MSKYIVYIRQKITTMHICIIVFLLILIGLIFVPGEYDVTVPSSVDDINGRINIDTKFYKNNVANKDNVLSKIKIII